MAGGWRWCAPIVAHPAQGASPRPCAFARAITARTRSRSRWREIGRAPSAIASSRSSAVTSWWAPLVRSWNACRGIPRRAAKACSSSSVSAIRCAQRLPRQSVTASSTYTAIGCRLLRGLAAIFAQTPHVRWARARADTAPRPRGRRTGADVTAPATDPHRAETTGAPWLAPLSWPFAWRGRLSAGHRRRTQLVADPAVDHALLEVQVVAGRIVAAGQEANVAHLARALVHHLAGGVEMAHFQRHRRRVMVAHDAHVLHLHAVPALVATGAVEVGDGHLQAMALGQAPFGGLAQVAGQLVHPVALGGAPAVAAVLEVGEFGGVGPLHAHRALV